MNIDYLIIGQGISGTFLSYELERAGLSFLVIDKYEQQSPSRIASGIINPVTGRRIVKTWMIDELMPASWDAYKSIGDILKIDCIKTIDNIDFFPTPQMRLAFMDRIKADDQYLVLPEDMNDWLSLLNYNFGYGVINPCYLVNLQLLLPAWRQRLLDKNLLREENFVADELVVEKDYIRYKDVTASRIIFCDGITGNNNRWFRNLPFAPNKGEVLLIEINGMPANSILKKGISIVPWKDNIFWVGSSHEWQFENDQPTTIFRERTEANLRSFLKLPFSVVDHWAAVRPATLERRPFVGLHPQFPMLAIFNGMGTKGCSLAPYFARELVNLLVNDQPLLPEIDVARFKKVMTRV